MTEYFIHPTAIVETNKIGKNTKIWHFAHVRENTEIGENCIIGKDVYIDKNVKIGNNCKIQNFATVYDGVEIEDDVFIGPHVCFTNDLYPRAKGEWKIVKTIVKKGASIGANSTVICGITIGENSMIGAGSVVTKDVPNNALVYGNPAVIKGYVCRCGAKLENNKCLKCNIAYKTKKVKK